MTALIVGRRWWRRTVRLHHTGGAIALRAPVHGPLNRDRDFDRMVEEIGRWWVDHRGPGWRPAWPRLPAGGLDLVDIARASRGGLGLAGALPAVMNVWRDGREVRRPAHVGVGRAAVLG